MRFLAAVCLSVAVGVFASVAPARADFGITSLKLANVGPLTSCPTNITALAVVTPATGKYLVKGSWSSAEMQADGSAPLPANLSTSYTTVQTVPYTFHIAGSATGWVSFTLSPMVEPAQVPPAHTVTLPPAVTATLGYEVKCPVGGSVSTLGPVKITTGTSP
jgi:hypothetical protein